MKKRLGNDFLFYWIMKENGVVVNPDEVIDFNIIIRHKSIGVKYPAHYDVIDGSPRVRCEALQYTGIYELVATWRVIDDTFADGYRDCTSDVESFEIVNYSAQESNTGNVITSEIAIGYDGLDAYEVWVKNGNEGKTYEDYIAFLQQPATEAAALANIATKNANEATEEAIIATQNAIAATDSILSNIISLEIRDDLCLWFETPPTYDGITFDITNGNLIATI